MKAENKRELPEFSFKDLKHSLGQALREAKDNGTCRKIKLPEPIVEIPPKEIRKIRTQLQVSQSVFAAMLNVPLKTAVSWETGLHKPTRAALRLLDIARKHPDILFEA
jgi:putative transcriptional regulator